MRNKKGQFIKGVRVWNKGKKLGPQPKWLIQKRFLARMAKSGFKHSEETKRKMSEINKNRPESFRKKMRLIALKRVFEGKHNFSISGNKHHSWKGNKVKYGALHDWVYYHKGEPIKCRHCKITSKEKRICWANKSHKYKRILTDWISLCYSCHSKYDRQYRFNHLK